MNPVFKALTRAVTEPENKQLLEWESFWYGAAANDPQFVEDTKRETLRLKLSVAESSIAAITQALQDTVATTLVKDGELTVEWADAARQPNSIVITQKNFSWGLSDFVTDTSSLTLPADATLKMVLAAAVLLARYPQIEAFGQPAVNPAQIADLPQALRRHVFRQIILGRKPSQGLRFLDILGLLDHFLPEVTAGRGLAQNRFHAHDIFEHLLRALDGAMDLNEPVRWSALLHDVGKVPTRVEGPDGEATFHNHEMYSARMVVPIMKRLAVPIGVGQKVKFLVRNHMFHYTDEWSDKAVRRFVKKVPLDELQDLISLRLADRKGSGKKSAFPKALQKLMHHIDDIIAQEKEFKIKDLALDGHKLMELGMPPSRAMGDMLKFLFEEVKAGRSENSEAALIKLVQSRQTPAV